MKAWPRVPLLGVAIGVASCRDHKPTAVTLPSEPEDSGAVLAADSAADPIASSSPDAARSTTVAAWASWPMPNSAPGLPNPQSYAADSAVVVTDRVTGLMWERRVRDALAVWAEANQQCEALTLGGYDDWRLPSRLELVSILDLGRTQPAIDVTAFPDTPNDWFWTSSPAADDPSAAWYVYFYFGYPKTELQSNRFSSRCVRTAAPRPAPAAHYRIEQDTVGDLATGLTWQRAVPAPTLVFDDARTYCSALTLAGKTGWRVPTMPELLTLIDERAAAPPMIDATAFPDTPSEAFWTSSYFGGATGMAWQVYFDRGNGLYGLPTATFRVRCVM